VAQKGRPPAEEHEDNKYLKEGARQAGRTATQLISGERTTMSANVVVQDNNVVKAHKPTGTQAREGRGADEVR